MYRVKAIVHQPQYTSSCPNLKNYQYSFLLPGAMKLHLPSWTPHLIFPEQNKSWALSAEITTTCLSTAKAGHQDTAGGRRGGRGNLLLSFEMSQWETWGDYVRVAVPCLPLACACCCPRLRTARLCLRDWPPCPSTGLATLQVLFLLPVYPHVPIVRASGNKSHHSLHCRAEPLWFFSVNSWRACLSFWALEGNCVNIAED